LNLTPVPVPEPPDDCSAQVQQGKLEVLSELAIWANNKKQALQ